LFPPLLLLVSLWGWSCWYPLLLLLGDDMLLMYRTRGSLILVERNLWSIRRRK
jgi:hypothetical protein